MAQGQQPQPQQPLTTGSKPGTILLVVNRVYQAIAIAIGITINGTVPGPPTIPLPPQPNETEPEGRPARVLAMCEKQDLGG